MQRPEEPVQVRVCTKNGVPAVADGLDDHINSAGWLIPKGLVQSHGMRLKFLDLLDSLACLDC